MNKQAILPLLAGAALGTLATAALISIRADDSAAARVPTANNPPADAALPPLETLMADIERRHGGRITELELEWRPWGNHYEMELTDAGFREWDIVVDAQTGELKHEHRDFD